ncbi:MAG TPA: hypothetical protein VG291_19480 [Xanthobacteraceae bacterium]|nr:hypothetical protein [Xanthobacteraceae bacterium]
MSEASSTAATAITAAFILMLTIGGPRAADDAKYPNWKGQWSRLLVPGVGGQGAFDQTRFWGRGQQAPLTPEYQKVWEDSMADQAKGGLGNYPPATCHPGGMPRMMYFGAQEYIITPQVTYILVGGGVDQHRRVFTDGRDFPADIEPTYQGYSIGRWIDRDGDGRYSVLSVETRGPFKGPRAFDASGLPLHADNQSIFKERFHLDPADPSILHDEITVIDHALSRPWSADRRYTLDPDPSAQWPEVFCVESNVNVVIGKENYVKSADGYLMPTKKDQAPPDLRYFKQPQK